MATILYTTTDAIRAAIGVDVNDVSDEILINQNLDLQMEERLSEFLPTHETVYDTDEGARRLSLWCQYFGALALLEDAVLAIPQKLQANNDQLSRFSVDFEVVKSSLRDKLKNLEAKLNPPATSLTGTILSSFVSASVAAYDPVTGP